MSFYSGDETMKNPEKSEKIIDNFFNLN